MTGGGAWGDAQTKFFFELTPDRVLVSAEALGLKCTGFCMALNSFENRVYEVEVEWDQDGTPESPSATRRVVKFYRPGRWTEEQILEEHQFLLDLVADEIPAIAPAKFADGTTLRRTEQGIWFAVFPKMGGRSPDELSLEQLARLGRLLARIHNTGARGTASHRVRISPQSYGIDNLKFLIDAGWIPLDFRGRYQRAVERISELTQPWFQAAPVQRIHGDCHLGNLLWNDRGPFFLDFDDMLQGPPVQDMWLLTPSRNQEGRLALEALLDGYAEMRQFDRTSLRLIEPLRALRFVHYTAWIARRWEDPAFPRAFPHFNTHRYWNDETEDLEKQLALIERQTDGGIACF